MKILHIEDRFHPDMGYQINYFAEYHNPGTEFHILSSESFSLWKGVDKEDIINNRDREFEKKHNVKITRINSYRSGGRSHNIWLKGLLRTVESLAPDVVYTHALETITSIRIILSRLNKKMLVFSDTHTLLNQRTPGLKNTIYNSFLERIYIPVLNKKNIGVFYTAEENKNILLDIYGVKKENVLPCPIGTNLKDYRFDEKAGKDIRQRLKIDINSPLILYTGKLNDIKKPHLLLNAVKEIENLLTGKIHIVMVGAQDKDYMQKYFNILFSEKVELHLTGSVSNKKLFEYYSAADFAVFPKENSLSSLDAQACRLPVIMEDDETNRLRLKEGGLCYRKDDVGDLGSKILNLINDKDLLKKLSENGYSYIRSNFDYANIVSVMEKIVEQRFESYSSKNKVR